MTTSHKVTVGLALVLAVGLLFASYGYFREHEARITYEAEHAQTVTQIKQLSEQISSVVATATQAAKADASRQAQVQTPAQVVKAIPQVIQLPAPVIVQTPDAPTPQAGTLLVPTADAKPLFDTLSEGAACKTELSATKQQVTLEQEKTAAVTKDRDAAVTSLKGGSKWHRVITAAKWAAVGVVAGYIAARH